MKPIRYVARALGLGLLGLLSLPSLAEEQVTAAERFEELERRLLAAATVRMQVDVKADGGNTAVFNGSLLLERGASVKLDFRGSLVGQAAAPGLVSNGTSMTYGPTGIEQQVKAPAALNEGLLLGLTRMGMLHNLAVLTEGGIPDGIDGHVREWARAVDFVDAGVGEVAGRKASGIRFGIVVNGQPSGKATLWLDQESGLPLRRDQAVDFSGGKKMRVVELYSSVELVGAPTPTRPAPTPEPSATP